MKISRTLKLAIKMAAKKLGSDAQNNPVKLEAPFQGSYVSLDNPETENTQAMSFQDVGLDKEGVFYLTMKDFLG